MQRSPSLKLISIDGTDESDDSSLSARFEGLSVGRRHSDAPTSMQSPAARRKKKLRFLGSASEDAPSGTLSESDGDSSSLSRSSGGTWRKKKGARSRKSPASRKKAYNPRELYQGALVEKLVAPEGHVVLALMLGNELMSPTRTELADEVLQLVWLANSLRPFLVTSIRLELRDAQEQTLFRSSSPFTVCFGRLRARPVCADYLKILVAPIVEKLLKLNVLSIDEAEVGPEQAAENAGNLTQLAEALLVRMRNTFTSVPHIIVRILRALSREVSARFSNEELGEKLTFSFFFLRFIVPHIIETGKERPESRLFASLLMNLANGREFGNGILRQWVRKNRLLYKSLALLYRKRLPSDGRDVTFIIPRNVGFKKASGTIVWHLSGVFESALVRAQPVFKSKLPGSAYVWLHENLQGLADMATSEEK